MRKIRLLIEYRGTNYHGWQKQKGKITIQSAIEERLNRITGEEIKLIGAGRTDAGVHALGQVAVFKTESRHHPEVFKRALNSLLPPDIRIIDSSEVSLDFHPRFSARAKSYIYLIYLEKKPPVFLADLCWAIPHELDLKAIRSASQRITGRHDFSGFRAAGCGARTTIRTISELSIEEQDEVSIAGIKIKGKLIVFQITGDAFLRYMVRNIVGTLLEIGRGKRDISSIEEILLRGDRRLAGITAPARGLFLKEVYY
ncbi:MAG: tRNA pseudouridine(38-40) synthase TruA [Thermodesulfovibrionales bacterium]|nr:tRNA pseudouridine(38-40) synthase TruA [Thermodesulfovibrionales bacterium]